MADSVSVQELNRQLACKVNEEARADPRSAYAGKFVGIANGQVVAVSENLNDLMRRLRQIEPDPQKSFCLEAGLDYDETQFIWGSI